MKFFRLFEVLIKLFLKVSMLTSKFDKVFAGIGEVHGHLFDFISHGSFDSRNGRLLSLFELLHLIFILFLDPLPFVLLTSSFATFLLVWTALLSVSLKLKLFPLGRIMVHKRVRRSLFVNDLHQVIYLVEKFFVQLLVLTIFSLNLFQLCFKAA